MIRRLRLRFIFVIMSILTLIFAFIVIAFAHFHLTEGIEQADDYLHFILFNEGQPQVTFEDAQDEALLNFCYLSLDSNLNLLSSSSSGPLYTDELISQLLAEILSQHSLSGNVTDQHRFLMNETDSGYELAILDISRGAESLRQLLSRSILLAVFVLFLLAIICFFLTKWMVRPVQQAFERQKEFISDASHELKTPLSVISANADVLADEIGENQFLSYIQSETRQMTHMVQDLLTLTRLDDASVEPPESFDLSQVVLQTALSFESTAFEANKTFSIAVDEGLHLTGHAGKIRQLVAILLDNAIKYSNENGTIALKLFILRGNPVLEVYNTGEGIAPSERQKIFQRFYRGDASRHRQAGSYGLGLPIAQSIAAAHKARIVVEGEEGSYVRLRVLF